MTNSQGLTAGIVLGVLLRIIHTFSSLGSLDALIWFRWVELVERVGVLESYRYSDLMNHPPLALWVAQYSGRVGLFFGLEFQDSFRLLQTAADIVSAVVLFKLVSRFGSFSGATPLQVSLLFFLSPASIFVSGFHCNSDPLMIMLLLLAILEASEKRAAAAGLLIAASVGIKIIALVALPFLFLVLRGRKRVVFLTLAVLGGFVVFLPGILVSGPVFLRNVFGYSGMVTGWGLRLLAGWASVGAFEFVGRALVIALLVALSTVLFAEWRRSSHRGEMDRMRLPAVIGLSYLVVLILAAGFGVQYLFWLLPFLSLQLQRRAAILLHGLISAFVFALYTVWAEGWPWWYAPGNTVSPAGGAFVARVGITLWIALVIAAIAAARKLYRRRSGVTGTSLPPT